MTDVEGLLIAQTHLSGQGFLLPPGRMLDYPAARVDNGGYSRIAATRDPSSGLDRSQACIGKMLAVSRSVSPPGIVGYHSQELSPLPYIFGAVLSVNRLIADRASYRDTAGYGARGIPHREIQVRSMSRADASPHHSPELVVDRTEESGIRRHLHPHHQLVLMEYLGLLPCGEHQG